MGLGVRADGQRMVWRGFTVGGGVSDEECRVRRMGGVKK